METSSSTQSHNAPDSPRIHLKTLGGLAVIDATGRPIHAAAALRRPVAVLIVAAASGQRGIARDKLVGLLWPDFHPDRARHSLTQAIYNARRVTGVDDLFLTDGVLRVNPQRVSSDIGELESAAQRGDLEGVAAQYEGAFLDGFFVPESPDFEHWVSINRARFEERVASALEELRARADRAGDDRRAIDWLRRLAVLRPLDSDTAAALAIRLAKAGDRAGALRHAQAHIEALKTQLDLEPDRSFLALIDSFRVLARAGDDNTQASQMTALPASDVVAPASPRRRWISRRLVVAVSVAGTAVALFAGLRTFVDAGTRGTTPARSVTRLLVAPFGTSGADSSLTYLGPGLAQLLARRLDSAGVVPADDSIVSRSWQHAASRGISDSSRGSLLEVTARRGIRRIIYGSVIGSPTRAIISATEVDVPDGARIARATVEGPADSIGQFARLLVAKLLVAEAGEDSALAHWETSFPALRAFLNGRRAARRFAYTNASQSFRDALQLDSAFAPAALQLARMADRLGDANELDAAVARAWPYRAFLNESERSELIALAGPEYPNATPRSNQLAAWSRLVRSAPQRAANWYALGSRFAHEGARISAEGANEQAVAALNRALVIDPRYAPARDLLGHLSLRASASSERAVTIDGSDSLSPLGLFLRWRAAMAIGDSETVRELRPEWPNASSENVRALAMASQFDAVGFGDGALALQVMRTRATSTRERVDLVLAAHSLELNLGHAASALSQTAELKRLRPDSHAYLRLRILDALYGGGDSAAAAGAARELNSPPDSALEAFSVTRSRIAADACVLAQWHMAHGDTAEVGVALAQLRAPDLVRDRQPVTASPSVCGDLIEAQRAVLSKDRRALALVDRLDQLVLSAAVAGNASEYAHIAVSRMYAALGHPRRALSALRRRTYMSGWPTYLATVWRDESRLAGLVGDERRVAVSTGRVAALRAASIAIRPSLGSP
jgi:DNA-binding SARP family transcriptional activator/tetratricopeptide (TPR) repeat protein